MLSEQASQELNDTPPVDATEQQWQWFYEGRRALVNLIMIICICQWFFRVSFCDSDAIPSFTVNLPI